MEKQSSNTNIEKVVFQSKASLKTQYKNVYKRNNAFAVEKVKEKIKGKRAAKIQEKNLKKAVEESLKQTAHKEKTAAIRQLKKKRLERTKIISKKTKRGQPIMKDRIQYLLTKIQETRRC